MSFQTILHPTDFSPSAEQAFQTACSLAGQYAARVIVLHVAVPPVVGYGGPTGPPPEGDWKALEEQLWKIHAADESVPVEHRLMLGTPAAEVVRVAGETQADLIVMGTHGRTGLSRFLMGSVA
ncbi:MAG TPA: universal stress protein, partial [Pirellulales bacterium]|nr:universal stress protein [Pirellulales bacterium]